jgi:hypothetical protein
VTVKKNGWLKVAGAIVSLIVGLFAIWTFVKSGVAGGATRESSQDMRLDAAEKCGTDHETRLRSAEKSLNEQRPIWRAVARKLNVELPRDTAGQ